MRPRRSRGLRRASALVAAGLFMWAGAATAIAGGGGGGGGGDGPGLAPNQCAVLAFWNTSTRLPNGASPYSGYSSVNFRGSEETPLDSVAIVINQRFPAVGYGGWFVYPESYELPTDGVTFPNVKPDAGSVNPFTEATPVLAPNRSLRIVMTAADIAQDTLPGSLRNIRNRVTWPTQKDSFLLLGRAYNEKAAYDRGGTGGPLDIDWPDIRVYDVQTGRPVDCEKVEPSRDFVQRFTPWNTEGFDGLAQVNDPFRVVRPQVIGAQTGYPPKPDPRLLQFFRMPSNGTGAPGGVVPPPLPDNCANYLSARVDPSQIALFRVPKVPSFQPKDVAPGDTFKPTDVGAYNFQTNGQFRSVFNPGQPDNYALGNEDIKQDATGGATVVVIPRDLGPLRRARLIAKAQANGWNLLLGNEDFVLYANMVFLRINGPASSYIGGAYPTDSRSGVPCILGPQSVLDKYPQFSGLKTVPEGTKWSTVGAEWAAVPAMMGSATPQGVQCTYEEFSGEQCLTRLKQHIADTGGSYTVGA